MILEEGFSEPGAKDLIAEYKDTLSFASMDQPDNLPPQDDLSEGDEAEDDGDASGPGSNYSPPPSPPTPPAKPKQEVKLMAGERELATGLLSKESSFRLFVSGQVGVNEIERLIRKLELDKEILADEPEHDPQDDPTETEEPGN